MTEVANFNGSAGNIAGVCNTGRNVVGVMPHPERAAEAAPGEESGKLLFDSLVSASVMARSA